MRIATGDYPAGFNPYTGIKAPDPYADAPKAPEYISAYDPLTMALAPGMKQRLDALKMDTRGLDAFRDMALRRGPSAWANQMTSKQYLEEADARERAKREARSSRAQAESDLAMRGGLSGGARERLAGGAMRDLLSMSQDTTRQGILNRMQIGVNDQTNKIQQLSQLPGMENIVYDNAVKKEGMYDTALQGDNAAATAEANRKNAYEQNNYQQQMQMYGANKQAKAIENSGKK